MKAMVATLAIMTAISGMPLAAQGPVAPTPPVAKPDPQGEQVLGIRYLYGSGEAVALSRQAFALLTSYALAQARQPVRDSVVLAAGATPEEGRFAPCGPKQQRAVIFDADETLVWNTGSTRWFAEHGLTYDSKVWTWWEKTGAGKARAVPGAVEALATLRAKNVAVIVNSNRAGVDPENAADTGHWRGTAATLKAAGLGDFVLGENLFLKGTGKDASFKDDRRAAIAARFCVIAMAGDQLGDFADAFNKASTPQERTAMAGGTKVAALWGNGWFVLPNPLYGSWDKATFADAFTDAEKW